VRSYTVAARLQHVLCTPQFLLILCNWLLFAAWMLSIPW